MTKYNNLLCNLQGQVHTKQIFNKIQEVRKHTLQLNVTDKNLPAGRRQKSHKETSSPTWGKKCQDPCTFGCTSVGAADIMYICT